MSELAIELDGVNKIFRRFQHPGWRALDALGCPVPRKCYDEFQALSDIDLKIGKGERVALIGRNGAGKSTLLRLIAGQMRADRGDIRVNGQIQALMTLGTGFHPEFTGIENIRSALTYQGLSSSRMEECIEEIADFTELDSFLQRPVKEYSAGMYARLAFAVATTIQPEILIIDEILGAGDAYFLGKCIQRMKALTSQGATILFVSHDISSVQMLCDRGIWLDRGRIRQDGPLLQVSKAYLASIREEEEKRLRAKSMSLTRNQVTQFMQSADRTMLLRFMGVAAPPASPFLIKGIEYGDSSGWCAKVDLSEGSLEESRLIVDQQFMNWRLAGCDNDQPVWAFGDFGGRYLHAPFQIAWPSSPVGGWIALELRSSSTEAVRVELFDAHTQTYECVKELPARESEQWERVEFAVDGAVLERGLNDRLVSALQAINEEDRYGSGEVVITGFGFFDEEQQSRHTLITGQPAFAILAYEAHQTVVDPVPVVAIYRPDGTCAMQVIGNMQGWRTGRIKGKGAIRVDFSPLLLGPGEYLVSVALFRELNLGSAIEPAAYDLHDRCHALKVLPPSGVQVQIGVVNQPAHWELLN